MVNTVSDIAGSLFAELSKQYPPEPDEPKPEKPPPLQFSKQIFWESLITICPTYRVNQYNKLVLAAIYENISGEDKRGILLEGGIGVGKTTIMRALSIATIATRHKKGFSILPSRNIASNAQKGGLEALEGLTLSKIPKRLLNAPASIYGVCIDDFGIGLQTVNYYGDKINILDYIILERYDVWGEYGYQTHITTNFDGGEMRRALSAAAYDRVKEMFICINLKGNSWREQVYV